MKKLLLIVGMIFTLVSCNPKESNDKKEANDSTATATTTTVAVGGKERNPLCIELGRLQTQEERERWIEMHREALCDGTLYECILQEHKVDFEKYYGLVKDYWGIRTPKYKPVTWLEIKKLIGDKCYPNYVGFEISGQDEILGLRMLTAFNDGETCYSPALFRAVDRLLGGLKDTDEFTFTLAKVGGEDRVVFHISDKITGITSFYDISDNPTFIEKYNFKNNQPSQ